MRGITLFILLIFLFVGCKRSNKNSESVAPELNLIGIYPFTDGTSRDSTFEIYLNYADKNGDLGLKPGDTFAPFNAGSFYETNLKIWYYAKVSGKWTKLQNPFSTQPDSIQFHERLPYITPTGRDKAIYGDIRVNIPAHPFGLKPDTVKFELQLIDRSLKKSPIIKSEAIKVNH